MQKISKIRIWIITGAAVFGLIGLLILFYSNSDKGTDKEIQNNFIALESKAELEAKALLTKTEENELKTTDSPIFLHLYENDSLKLWNTNSMPVPRLSSLRFPSNGLVHLKNGWYYSVEARKGNKLAVASFLVKQSYQYENEYLSNRASPNITDKNFKLSLDDQEGKKVLNKANNYCFFICLNEGPEKKHEHISSVVFRPFIVVVIRARFNL